MPVGSVDRSHDEVFQSFTHMPDNGEIDMLEVLLRWFPMILRAIREEVLEFYLELKPLVTSMKNATSEPANVHALGHNVTRLGCGIGQLEVEQGVVPHAITRDSTKRVTHEVAPRYEVAELNNQLWLPSRDAVEHEVLRKRFTRPEAGNVLGLRLEVLRRLVERTRPVRRIAHWFE